MKNKNLKKSIIFYSFTLLAVLTPVTVMWFRSLPPNAEMADKLWIQIFSQERNYIESELGQRTPNTITEAETTARWAIMKQSMLDQGATQEEMKIVLPVAEDFYPSDKKGNYKLPHWPILIKRGYVQGKPVWVSVGAAKSETPLEVEIVTGWNYYVRAIDPNNPREMSDVYSSNAMFPRCYGPNTPFPITP